MRTTGNGSRRGLGDSPRPSMPREPMKSKVVLLGDGGVGLAGRIPTVFAGNKSDLVPDRVWAEEYLYFLTQKYSCPGVLTSAKTGDRVESSFKALGEQILQAAGHPIRRIALVTPPQEPVDRLIRVTDKIMTDFCYHLGGVETGMPIVKRQLGPAGLDVRAPTTDAIRTLIERLAVVEQDFKGPEEVLSNRERRLDWLVGTDS